MFLTAPGKIFVPVPVLLGVVGALALIVLAVSMMGKNKKAAVAAPVAAAPVAASAAAPAVVSGPVAPGSAGKLKLYDTPPKTAAMVMAVVADKLGKPINELRFISIKEVK